MAPSSDVRKSKLNDWVEAETRALDMVASWEALCDAYRTLEFSDPIGDSVRMEEFKWIIREMNKHLTRARRQLLSCRDKESMAKTLSEMFSSSGTASISGRKELAYHKLRQRWVMQMMAELETMEEEEKEEEDGGTDYWLG